MRILFAVYFATFIATIVSTPLGESRAVKWLIAAMAVLAGIYGCMLGLNYQGSATWAEWRFARWRGGFSPPPQTMGWALAAFSVVVVLVLLFGRVHTASN